MARPTNRVVHRGELPVHIGQCIVDPGPNRAQRVIGGNEGLELHGGEQVFAIAAPRIVASLIIDLMTSILAQRDR